MGKNNKNELLSVSEMYEADRRTMEGGICGLQLMEAAGASIARAIAQRWTARKTVILCGPGNNGGDGFVVARLLHQKGWFVKVLLLGERKNLKGDAKINAERWVFECETLCPENVQGAELIVDAVFGAGLARAVEGIVADTLKAAKNLNVPVVGVDVPSGVDGDTGAILGTTLPADLTITFCRAKTGHYLYPARATCGQILVSDIGIPDQVIETIAPTCCLNRPAPLFPWPRIDGHKYNRGHSVIIGGKSMTGAARLAALCARRIGSGLVTITAQASAYMIYRQAEPGNIVSNTELEDHLSDPRKNAYLIGPGLGDGSKRLKMLHQLWKSPRSLVVDADALRMMASTPMEKRAGQTLLTPHEGEFKLLFPDLSGSKLERARQAAQLTGCCILLKGADSVIAAPDGRCVINDSGTPWLATAGSGDSLAGFCVGLMAQHLEAFEAACLATWLHGKCAEQAGPGLIAEDIGAILPLFLKTLQK